MGHLFENPNLKQSEKSLSIQVSPAEVITESF